MELVVMATNGEVEGTRSIRFPLELWKAIDAEATRCKRSSVKQMEAVLAMYYALSNVNISAELIETVKRRINPPLELPNELKLDGLDGLDDAYIFGKAIETPPKEVKRKKVDADAVKPRTRKAG